MHYLMILMTDPPRYVQTSTIPLFQDPPRRTKSKQNTTNVTYQTEPKKIKRAPRGTSGAVQKVTMQRGVRTLPLRKPETRNPTPQFLNPHSNIPQTKPQTLKPEPYTLSLNQQTLYPQPQALNSKPRSLTPNSKP
jgi:hypothetical protein